MKISARIPADIPDWMDDSLEIFREPVPVVSREEWGARAPYSVELVGLPHPRKFVLLMYTRTDTCETDEECTQILRERQRVQMNLMHLADIQWNFMIGGNGKVYMGRGWNTNATKDIENYPWDYKSIDIAYVGRFTRDIMPEMKIAASKLIHQGMKQGYLIDDVDVLDDMIYRAEEYLDFDPRVRIF